MYIKFYIKCNTLYLFIEKLVKQKTFLIDSPVHKDAMNEACLVGDSMYLSRSTEFNFSRLLATSLIAKSECSLLSSFEKTSVHFSLRVLPSASKYAFSIQIPV